MAVGWPRHHRAGDNVVMRYFGHPSLVGTPAIVVEDCPDQVMTYLPHGAGSGLRPGAS